MVEIKYRIPPLPLPPDRLILIAFFVSPGCIDSVLYIPLSGVASEMQRL